ncbi:MAG: carboxypeptidase-like regulatory domain-containing protein [bacterium]
MSYKRLILVVSILSAGLMLQGCLTGTIKGQVIDQNDRPVPGAIVTTSPPSHSVRTTENGYRLQNVPQGEYTVKAEKPGFYSGSTTIQVQWNETTAADIQIKRKK